MLSNIFVLFFLICFNRFARFDQRKLSGASPDGSPLKHSQRQRQNSDDDADMEATLGPQHGKFEAKAPEIEELKLRVEALQAQVTTFFQNSRNIMIIFLDCTVGAAVGQRYGTAVPSWRVFEGKQGDEPAAARSTFVSSLSRPQTLQMTEMASMKQQLSADLNVIASCASLGFDSINSRVVEMADILQRVVTLLTMK